jgi:protein-disulfide isomerase
MTNQFSKQVAWRILVVATLVAAAGCTKKVAQNPSPQVPAPTVPRPAPAVSPHAAPDNGTPARGESHFDLAAIDLGKLDAFKRKVFDQVVNREPSACGKGHSLLHSIEHDSACRASFYAVRYVARLADAGLSEPEITEKLQQRFRTPRVQYIDVSQAPSKGAPSGRVKVVEFADYQCSHCKEAQSLMHQLLADYPNDLTIYFKHFPLGGHPASSNAAIAAVGAQKQGKFWQYNDKIWENMDRISPAVLEGLAKQIGLDFDRWYGDLSSDDVRSHVLRDRDEARSLAIHRTPGIFINNRRYTDDIDLVGLKDWIDEELGR